jgi:predicted nucleotidyltransferase
MIREGRKLSKDTILKIPEIVDVVSHDEDIVALYSFGSLAEGHLKPLSDLDFAVLLTLRLAKEKRFDRHLSLLGEFNRLFKTDEVDLILLNDAPLRFVYQIQKEGKLLFCRDRTDLGDFNEYVIKTYLDFKYFRESFDRVFLEGIRYYG